LFSKIRGRFAEKLSRTTGSGDLPWKDFLELDFRTRKFGIGKFRVEKFLERNLREKNQFEEEC